MQDAVSPGQSRQPDQLNSFLDLKRRGVILKEMSAFEYVRQKDIAKSLGVSQVTVCLALKNDPRISEAMRKRVLNATKKMGYRPDPGLSSLAYWRKSTVSKVYQSTIIVLSPYQTPRDWRSCKTFEIYGNAFQEKCLQSGHKVEEISCIQEKIPLMKIQKMLLARGIRGILIPPQISPGDVMNMDFSPFSLITIGFSLEKPQIHVVTTQQYLSMMMMVQKIQQKGYRRIGLAVSEVGDRRVSFGWSSGYYAALRKNQEQSPLPVFDVEQKNPKEAFYVWLQKSKPDVIIGQTAKFIPWLTEKKIRFPKDIGIAGITTDAQPSTIAGINENSSIVGSVAAETLIDMMNRHVRGIPIKRKIIQVEGSWYSGKSLRK